MCSWKPEKGLGFPGTGVTGGGELPGVGPGHLTRVLCENSEPCLQPLAVLFINPQEPSLWRNQESRLQERQSLRRKTDRCVVSPVVARSADLQEAAMGKAVEVQPRLSVGKEGDSWLLGIHEVSVLTSHKSFPVSL